VLYCCQVPEEKALCTAEPRARDARVRHRKCPVLRAIRLMPAQNRRHTEGMGRGRKRSGATTRRAAMKTRCLASVVSTAKKPAPALPFARGARRAAFIAKRRAAETQRKSA
jgi:hypothetical protein